MKIDRKCKIELATSNDAALAHLQDPYLDNSNVIATDTHILAIVPISDTDDDVNGFVPVDAIKAARKLVGTISCDGDALVAGGTRYPRDEDTAFVNWRRVWPDGDPDFSVTLDVKLLSRLSQALGNPSAGKASAPVMLHFFGDDDGSPSDCRAIAVTVGANHGVIMPMKTKGAYSRPDGLA